MCVPCVQVQARHEGDVLTLHAKLEDKRKVAADAKARILSEEKQIKFEQMQQVGRLGSQVCGGMHHTSEGEASPPF